MEKLAQLAKALQTTEVRFICQSHIETNDSQFGFTLGNGVWYWFSIINGNFYFQHAYSQNTGKTIKRMTYRNRAISNLESKFNVKYYS